MEFCSFTISDQKLTNCDHYRLIKIELVHCNKYEEEVSQDFLTLTVDELINNKCKFIFKSNPDAHLEFIKFSKSIKYN